MNAGDDRRKSLSPQTHRGHLSRIGGVRRRLPGAVHDGLESLSTFAGIRSRSVNTLTYRDAEILMYRCQSILRLRLFKICALDPNGLFRKQRPDSSVVTNCVGQGSAPGHRQ
jgi:hypothetical protein